MFIFEGVELDNNNIALLCFKVNGRSIFEIASLYQEGIIKRSFIKTHCNKTMYVRLINNKFSNELFKSGNRYHLYIKNNDISGYPILELFFEEDSYVASCYIKNIDGGITQETWKDLFGKETPPIDLPTINEEYFDHKLHEYYSDTYSDGYISDCAYSDIDVGVDADIDADIDADMDADIDTYMGAEVSFGICMDEYVDEYIDEYVDECIDE